MFNERLYQKAFYNAKLKKRSDFFTLHLDTYLCTESLDGSSQDFIGLHIHSSLKIKDIHHRHQSIEKHHVEIQKFQYTNFDEFKEYVMCDVQDNEIFLNNKEFYCDTDIVLDYYKEAKNLLYLFISRFGQPDNISYFKTQFHDKPYDFLLDGVRILEFMNSLINDVRNALTMKIGLVDKNKIEKYKNKFYFEIQLQEKEDSYKPIKI